MRMSGKERLPSPWRLALLIAAVFCHHSLPLAQATDRNDHTVLLVPAPLVDSKSPDIAVLGAPDVNGDTDYPGALLFDGHGDGIFINQNYLAGLDQFTIEVIFRPDPGGTAEQRFFHIGEVKTSRMLLELRVIDDGYWALDSFFRSAKDYLVLLDRDLKHPLGEWAHVAIVMDRGQVKNYVNGQLELEGELDFDPIPTGRTSIGVRLNEIDWFKGAIQSIRITARPLTPASFQMSALEPENPQK